MIHGIQKITLTKASVSEALQDYLQKHMGDGVQLQLQSWGPTSNTYGADTTLDVDFEQRKDKPPQEKL